MMGGAAATNAAADAIAQGADATAGGWFWHRLFLLLNRSFGKSAAESSINVVWCAELRQEAVLVLL